MNERIAVGRVNATWGLRGHVKVTPLTSNPERFQKGAVLLVRGEPRRVLDVNTSQGYPIVQFEGYTDAIAAEGRRFHLDLFRRRHHCRRPEPSSVDLRRDRIAWPPDSVDFEHPRHGY